MHVCALCDPGSLVRTVGGDPGVPALRFPEVLEGPKGRAQGGAAVAALGCVAQRNSAAPGAPLRRITGRLQRPVPLNAPLDASVAWDGGNGSVQILDGEVPAVTGTVETGEPLTVQGLPERLRQAVARMAAVSGAECQGKSIADEDPDPNWVEPTCYGCSRPRDLGGLFLPGWRVAPDVIASPFVAEASHRDAEGHLAWPIAVAATDCSTGICFSADRDFQKRLSAEDKAYITGSLDYYLLRPAPLDGRAYRVLGTPDGIEGRKMFGAAGLFDEAGTPYVVCEGTWLVIPMPDEWKKSSQPASKS